MYPINREIVLCRRDVASVNICEALLAQGGWEDAGSDGVCSYKRRGNDLLVDLPDKHLYTDNIDKRAVVMGFRPDVVIFPSVHSAGSGRPALTVHPIGNYNDAMYGGRERTLVKASPSAMSSSLRCIKEKCRMPEFNICFEVTHHGPWLETPTYFLEIGSDMDHWPRKDAGELQAEVLRDTAELDPEPFPALIGVGGGHYAPRFTEMALEKKVDFGHMLPNYQMEGRSDEDIARMMESAMEATGTEMGYLHRKSMKGPEAHRIKDIGEAAGVQWMRSEDLEPLH